MPPTSRTAGGAVLALAVLAAAGYVLLRPKSGDPPPADPWFADVTDTVGVDFVHDPGELGTYWMPQVNGSGVAVCDFDGDGRPDVYFLTFGGPTSPAVNRLYKNMPDGTLADVTAGSGLGIPGHNTGVTVGDVDNDGRPDVVVTQYGGLRLFRNLGGMTFADATGGSGLTNPQWAASANLFDYDRDGFLDLVVVNYVDYDPAAKCPDPTGRPEYCGPHLFKPTVTRLFRNRGGSGASGFEDVTVRAGLAKVPGPGLGVYCADFTGDGWPDVFVANDLKANHLWVNRQDGTFTEEGVARGIGLDAMGQAQSGMGVAAGDVDNDGLLDVYVTHLTSEHNTLWVQTPRAGQFRDRTADAGLLNSDWRGTGWGTVMADFDRDGWADVVVVNGRVVRGGTAHPPLGTHFQDYAERNQVFRNDGGTFQDVSGANPALCGTPNNARGLAAGDLDGDGALDLVVTTVGARARVFRNVARDRGHWQTVRAIDPRLNRDAYGAEVRVRAGGRRQLRVVNPGDSFQSCSDPRPHFGLGGADRYDEVHVRWPDGLAEVFPGGPADRAVDLRRGGGRAEPPGTPGVRP